MNLTCIIEEAKCCSANMGYEYAMEAKTGTLTDALKYRFLALNMFIRILLRHEKREKDFCKKNKSLSLNTPGNVIGICLCEQDLQSIVEQIKLLCSTCNCNC